MKDQACKENDEEVVGVPEHLIVASSYHLHRWCNHKDKSEGDHNSCKASNGSERK